MDRLPPYIKACEAAARPDVDEQYQNHCVECSLEYYNGGVSATYLIPVTPTPADTVGAVATVGVSLKSDTQADGHASLPRHSSVQMRASRAIVQLNSAFILQLTDSALPTRENCNR